MGVGGRVVTAGAVREWRLTYRRSSWQASTRTRSETFTVEADALRRFEELQAQSRPDSGHLEVCRLEVRTVTTSEWSAAL